MSEEIRLANIYGDPGDGVLVKVKPKTVAESVEVFNEETGELESNLLEHVRDMTSHLNDGIVGQPGGLATLDEGGEIPQEQMPSDLIEFYDRDRDGKVNESDLADLALDSNLVGGRDIEDFYDQTEVNFITARYTYHQVSASERWEVQHNLGRFPVGVVVVDSAGSIVEGAVRYISNNVLEILFNYAFSGTVYIG